MRTFQKLFGSVAFSFVVFGLVVCSAAWSSPAVAGTAVDEAFELIKNTGKDFEVSGTVCEEMARVQVARSYPEPEFTVVSGIAYGADLGVIGELDVIVFDNKAHAAIKIAEVKCWENFGNGLRKAREQRQRFLSAVKSARGPMLFKSTSSETVYPQELFSQTRDWIAIGQAGAKAAGFDDEIPYSLSEMMELRERLMHCQKRRRCPKL